MVQPSYGWRGALEDRVQDVVMYVGILGPLEIHDESGCRVEIPGARRRALLLRLLVVPNQPVAFDRLAEDLWGGDTPRGARSTLATHISWLRQQLGADRVRTQAGGYAVSVGPGELDVDRFEAAQAAGRSAASAHDHEAAVECFATALRCWRGPALADVADTAWATGTITRLVELHCSATDGLLVSRLALGKHHDVVASAEAAVDEQPLREERWAILMLALYRSGRQADALRAYQRLRALLGGELGIDPSAELVALEDAILLQRPELDCSGASTYGLPFVVPPPGVDLSHSPAASSTDLPRKDGTPVPRIVSSDQLSTNLPAPVSGFVGRQLELAKLDKLLAAHRLVSVVGAGGIGKTRLAIEAAARRVEQTRDGVWFVDLTLVADPGNIVGVVAGALGLRSTSDERLEDVLVERVRDMNALVVFDNCEHLIGEVADLVERLLEAGAELRVMATSREALRVPGETVWQTPPIATPEDPDNLDAATLAGFDAVRLFVERVGEQDDNRDLDLAALRLVGAVTGKLDGLPLAIELTAAGAGVLGLRGLSALYDHPGLSGRGLRTTHSRHKTMEATIDWSYRLLPTNLQAAMQRLSVFVGGFTIEAARAVAADTETTFGDMAAAVAALAERSLVTIARTAPGRIPGAKVRYTMLETIRQFAAGRLVAAAGAEGQARVGDAHSRWFAELASRASGALVGWQQGRWLDAIELEHGNIGAAIACLLDQPGRGADALHMIVHLDRFWHNRGHLAQCASLLQRALDLTGDEVDADLRCSALRLAGQASIRRDLAVSTARFTECLALAREAGSDYRAAQALAGLATASYDAGDEPATGSAGRQAVELARRAGDPVLLGECLVAYGLSTTSNDLTLCRSVHNEAIGVTRRSGDRAWLAWAHNNFGNGLLTHRELSVAGEHFRHARAILADIGMPDPVPLINLGWVCLGQRDLDGALEAFSESVRLAHRFYLPVAGAYGALGLACTSARYGDFEGAAMLLGFADAGLERCGAVTWAEPERSYREDALAEVTVELGLLADSAYDTGRVSERDDMLEVVRTAPTRAIAAR